jgi:hypothetical protein
VICEFTETNAGGIEVYFLFVIINSDEINDSLWLEMVKLDDWSFYYFFCGPSLQISCWAPLKSYSVTPRDPQTPQNATKLHL